MSAAPFLPATCRILGLVNRFVLVVSVPIRDLARKLHQRHESLAPGLN